MTREQSTAFVVTFRPTGSNTDPIRALRAVLKFALRRFGLRAVDAREILDRASPDCPAPPALAQRTAQNRET
jgi:hypothetical protein